MEILVNLLPPSEKEEIKNLRKIGIVIKISFAALCAIAVFVTFLFYMMKSIRIQEEVVAKEIVKFEQSQSFKEVKEAQDSLREYSKIASKVQSGLKRQNQYWVIISEINSIIPQDIVLTEMMIDKEGILGLKGTAYTREALLSLKEDLESSEKFGKIESPISNFVADKDVKFEFTAEIK